MAAGAAARGKSFLSAGDGAVKQAAVNRLTADDGGGAEDVVRARAAADLGGGPREAGEDLAEGVRAGEVLHELVGDVAAVEVGEDEDVGLAGDGAGDALGAGDEGIERG